MQAVKKAQPKWSSMDLIRDDSQLFLVFCLLVALFIPWKDSGSEKMRNKVEPWKSLERIQEVLETQLLHLDGFLDWEEPGQQCPGAQVLLSLFISKDLDNIP